MKTAIDVQREQAQRDWQRQQDDALVHIYRKYPTVIPSIASGKAIVEFVSKFFGVQPGEMLVTLADVELARKENPAEFRQVFKYGLNEPVEVQRQSVMDDIRELLGDDSFRAERGRLRGMDLEALKARRAEIQLKRNLNQYSTEEIKGALKSVRQPGQRQDPLPAEWTRERLLAASSHCIKFLNARYGITAVNNRLANRG